MTRANRHTHRDTHRDTKTHTHKNAPAMVNWMLDATVSCCLRKISPVCSVTENVLGPCMSLYESGSAPASAVAFTTPTRVLGCAARGIVNVSDGFSTVGSDEIPVCHTRSNTRTACRLK